MADTLTTGDILAASKRIAAADRVQRLEVERQIVLSVREAEAILAADRKRAAAHLQRVLDLYPPRRMSNALRCDLEVVLSYIEIGEPAP